MGDSEKAGPVVKSTEDCDGGECMEKVPLLLAEEAWAG